MNRRLDISKVLMLEGIIWFFILCCVLFAIRTHNYKEAKSVNQYQIFISDVDGLIVGSPVKFMGVQIGYVNYLEPVNNEVYVKFIINDKNANLPKGVVANVEFSGLGGTKSLELYPPTERDLKTEKIINIKETFRLADSVDLLDNMFSKISLIGGRMGYFINKLSPYITEQTTENLEILGKSAESFKNKLDNHKNR